MAIECYFLDDKFPDVQVIATPGRFFAGTAYSLVTTVIDRRSVDASSITGNG